MYKKGWVASWSDNTNGCSAEQIMQQYNVIHELQQVQQWQLAAVGDPLQLQSRTACRRCETTETTGESGNWLRNRPQRITASINRSGVKLKVLQIIPCYTLGLSTVTRCYFHLENLQARQLQTATQKQRCQAPGVSNMSNPESSW